MGPTAGHGLSRGRLQDLSNLKTLHLASKLVDCAGLTVRFVVPGADLPNRRCDLSCDAR